MHNYMSVSHTLTRCYSYSEVYINRLIEYLIIHDRLQLSGGNKDTKTKSCLFT